METQTVQTDSIRFITQEEIAEAIGESQSTIDRLLKTITQTAINGEVHIESLQLFNIWNFCNFLRCQKIKGG